MSVERYRSPEFGQHGSMWGGESLDFGGSRKSVPLVSVLTPVFNGAKYLPECLASVRNQTHPRVQHIIVNDGSTDGTQGLLDTYKSSGCIEAVVVVEQLQAGEAAALNNAWTHVRGEYAVVLNADDRLHPDAISTLVNELAPFPGSAGAYPSWNVIDETGRTIGSRRYQPFDPGLFYGDFINLVGPGAMFRVGHVKHQELRSERWLTLADYEFWLRLSLSGSFIAVDMCLADWRLHSEGLTARSRNKSLATCLVALCNDFYATQNLPASIRKYNRQARSMSRYRAASYKLFDRAIPGRRLMLTSALTLFARQSAGPQRRRSLLVVLAVYAMPISGWIMRRNARLGFPGIVWNEGAT